ncbi:MAG: ABC transporter ATP-binding protein [Lachnospiraceae bacterium]|nr:ABC transporter ATP-binding protein [Lachnospiraceae bacterium]
MLLKQNKKYGFIDMVTLSFKTSVFYSLLFGIKQIIDALLPTLSIFVNASFINNAIAISRDQRPVSTAYPSIALLVCIMLYNTLSWIFMDMIECRRKIFYREKIRKEIFKNTAMLEYRHIENSEVMDLLERISWPLQWEVWTMYSLILNAINYLVHIAGILITLYAQVWWLALSMLISGIPILYIATKAGERSYGADKEMTKIDRRASYLSKLMTNREAVDERMLFQFTDNLNKQYEEKYEYARKFRLKVMLNNTIKQRAGGLITTVYSVVVILVLLPLVVDGSMTIGMFIASVTAVFGLASKLSWGVNWLTKDITQKRWFLKDLTEYMSLERCEGATDLPTISKSFDKITFKNVSFIYPGTNKIILDDVSFDIERGKHYSFVGKNGAGKTTITKLITGLYDNYEGEILVDGRSLREFTQSELKGLTSVVYQDFVVFGVSMFHNIALGDVNSIDTIGSKEEAEKAAKMVGLKPTIEKLKNGINTILGKSVENGVDLSGGEWQRVAIARSIVNKAPLKILDEPTASLDPIGESVMYNHFKQISSDMTTIFISHRLGSTKLADIIFVLDNGKIVEKGSHADLMKNNGLYAEMFNAQAEWYKTEDLEAVSYD